MCVLGGGGRPKAPFVCSLSVQGELWWRLGGWVAGGERGVAWWGGGGGGRVGRESCEGLPVLGSTHLQVREGLDQLIPDFVLVGDLPGQHTFGVAGVGQVVPPSDEQQPQSAAQRGCTGLHAVRLLSDRNDRYQNTPYDCYQTEMTVIRQKRPLSDRNDGYQNTPYDCYQTETTVIRQK